MSDEMPDFETLIIQLENSVDSIDNEVRQAYCFDGVELPAINRVVKNIKALIPIIERSYCIKQKAPTNNGGDLESVKEYIFVDIIDGIYEAQENENTTLDISVDMARKIIKEFRQKDKRIAELEGSLDQVQKDCELMVHSIRKGYQQGQVTFAKRMLNRINAINRKNED